jgi:hypothetical protein
MRSYIENGVENVIENVISNVVENVISNVIENALKTVALLTPLKTAQFYLKFKYKQQKQNFIYFFSCMDKTKI